MRKLLSIGALAATSLITVWQPAAAEPQPAPQQQASVINAAYVHRGRYYYHGRYYPHRTWHRGYWRRGRFYPGYYRYF